MTPEERDERLLARDDSRVSRSYISTLETASIMREVDMIMEPKGLMPVDYQHKVIKFTWEAKQRKRYRSE